MSEINTFSKSEINNNLKEKLKNKLELSIFPKVDSTNNKVKTLIKNNQIKTAPAFLAVLAADQQTKGRGRRGSSWFSEDPASIAVTFVFEIKKNIDKVAQITAAAALAVYDTLSFFGLDSTIKWPNDILAGGKKIAGILSELIFNKNDSSFVIIGCGLNLNNEDFNSEIKNTATSYYLEKKKKLSKNKFLAKLIEKMAYYIQKYLKGNRKKIINIWKAKLKLKNCRIELTHKNNKNVVFIKDILDSGELLVIFEDGVEKKIKSINTSLDYQSLKKYDNVKK